MHPHLEGAEGAAFFLGFGGFQGGFLLGAFGFGLFGQLCVFQSEYFLLGRTEIVVGWRYLDGRTDVLAGLVEIVGQRRGSGQRQVTVGNAVDATCCPAVVRFQCQDLLETLVSGLEPGVE